MSDMTILRQVRVLISDTDTSDLWKQDWEVNDAITAAVPEVELDYPQGYSVLVSGESTISPAPDETTKKLFALKTAIIIVSAEAVKSDRESIYVKDGDTAIDTTKGGANKAKLLESLKADYDKLINQLNINIEGTKGYRIDMYDMEFI